MSKSFGVLLRTMLRSTSIINRIRFSKDSKVRGKAIGGLVGLFFLYAMLMGYSIAMCAGYGMMGLDFAIPGINALSISSIAFLLSIFKVNGYLFNFKEYDMLMALPYRPRDIAASKFLYMYIKSLPWYYCLSGAMLIGYGIYAKPDALVYILWLLLTLVLPLIPTLLATLIGSIIAAASSGFRKTNIVQTILLLLIVVLSFSFRFIVEAVFKNDEVEAVLGSISDKVDSANSIYVPAKWFSEAVLSKNILSVVLLVISSLLLFGIMFAVIGKYYRKINSSLKSHAASKAYEMKAQKKNSVINAIVFKEFRRMISSSNYLVNACVGEFLALIMSVAVLIVGFDRVIALFTDDAPIPTGILLPAIPFIVYFLTGMISTTTISPSLEGKNYWIVQSLPISKKTLYQGKMLFNMYLTVPVSLITTICLCISAGVPLLNSILYLVQSVVLCGFSTTLGCVCGIKFIKLQWENELEVIKQGAAVVIYMLPNMFVTMGLTVLVVFLGTKIDPNLVTLIMLAIQIPLTLMCYKIVMVMAGKK